MVDDRGVSVVSAQVAVDLILLRTAIGDAPLRPGMVLAGRVAERSGEHGLLMLRGTPVVAQLPPELAAGTRVRLQVAEATADRVLLQVLPEAPAPAASAPAATSAPVTPPVLVPLPGGLTAQVRVEPDGSGSRPDGAALPALREALARAVGRPLLVTLHPRTQALDVSA